jgi:hypothetical protein
LGGVFSDTEADRNDQGAHDLSPDLAREPGAGEAAE